MKIKKKPNAKCVKCGHAWHKGKTVIKACPNPECRIKNWNKPNNLLFEQDNQLLLIYANILGYHWQALGISQKSLAYGLNTSQSTIHKKIKILKGLKLIDNDYRADPKVLVEYFITFLYEMIEKVHISYKEKSKIRIHTKAKLQKTILTIHNKILSKEKPKTINHEIKKIKTNIIVLQDLFKADLPDFIVRYYYQSNFTDQQCTFNDLFKQYLINFVCSFDIFVFDPSNYSNKKNIDQDRYKSMMNFTNWIRYQFNIPLYNNTSSNMKIFAFNKIDKKK